MPTRILIADDQPDVLEALRLLLKRAGYLVVTASSPATILAAARDHELGAVLMDLNFARDTTSGREGLGVLEELVAADAALPIVVMTAWSSVEGAVAAMQRGARDYIPKPWENQRLLQTLRTQLDMSSALREQRRLSQETSRQRERDLPTMVTQSAAMQSVLRLLERIAPSGASVLITGEHGTGKEVAARWLHAHSPRAAQPFVAVNAGGLGEGVFESELFGHVKGAFTDAKADRAGCLELAEGGTLFLDEIGNMPLAQQAKLLRVLQSGEYHPVGSSRTRRADVRFLSATNADIRQQISDGRFREDLLYRLNTVQVHLPPLRDRQEDILPLAAEFATRIGARQGQRPLPLSPLARCALLEHGWPGNVRELEHVIERALLLAPGPNIEPADLALGQVPGDAAARLERMTIEQAERHLIQRALARTGGQVSEAAKALGLSRSALYRRLQHFGLKGSE